MSGFTKLYHNIWEEIRGLKVTEKLFLIYLLDKQNYYGNKPFFITDEQIGKDLGICRKTIYLCRKGVKKLPFFECEPGKYRKSASKYYIKRVNLTQKACKNYPTIRSNKEEIKKEEDFSIPQNWKETTLRTMGMC